MALSIAFRKSEWRVVRISISSIAGYFKLKMQEDSPGRQDKRTRNERYNTPTKPKRLSVLTAKHKAKEFAAKDDKSTRVLAKQAILKELNTQLVVKAQGIAPQNRRKEDKAGNDSGMVHNPQVIQYIACPSFIWREI